jgi:hypothetical protein
MNWRCCYCNYLHTVAVVVEGQIVAVDTVVGTADRMESAVAGRDSDMPSCWEEHMDYKTDAAMVVAHMAYTAGMVVGKAAAAGAGRTDFRWEPCVAATVAAAAGVAAVVAVSAGNLIAASS